MRTVDGTETVVETTQVYPIPGTCLRLRRATEEDFLD